LTKRDPNKPDEILDAAAALFATKPFHEVRLDDIAALAKIGKGTIYLYWSSKEEVYLSVIRRGFAAVLSRVDIHLAASRSNVWDQLFTIVNELASFAFEHSGVYHIMRSGQICPEDADLQRVRAELSNRIQEVISEGVKSGAMTDLCPALTTQYILSFVRGAMLYPPPNMTKELLIAHMTQLLKSGLACGGKS